MLSDSIRKWNPWWLKGEVGSDLLGIEREKMAEIKPLLVSGQIKDITGVRRGGKTVLLYQIIRSFVSSGVDPKNLVMLNFDDTEIYNSDFDLLLVECRKIKPEISHIFLDEAQEKEGWERWVRTLYDTKEFKAIFVSGSSASILKSDISRVLSGRHSGFVLFPFSFKEYLRFHGWDDFREDYVEYNKGKVLHFLERYIKEGGFPETLGKEEFERNRYLNDLFDDIVAKDIAAKHKLDYSIAKKIAYYLISNSAKAASFRSISRACGVSTDTASKYTPFISECFLSLPLKKFSPKLKEQMRGMSKYYSVDTGLANAVGYKITDEFTRLMENTVFIELQRRHIENKKITVFYWQDLQQKEVDFVIRDGFRVTQLIQVSYDIGLEETKKREVSGLLAAMTELKLNQGFIITWDHEGEEEIKGKKITYIPLWKWLLA